MKDGNLQEIFSKRGMLLNIREGNRRQTKIESLNFKLATGHPKEVPF